MLQEGHAHLVVPAERERRASGSEQREGGRQPPQGAAAGHVTVQPRPTFNGAVSAASRAWSSGAAASTPRGLAVAATS